MSSLKQKRDNGVRMLSMKSFGGRTFMFTCSITSQIFQHTILSGSPLRHGEIVPFVATASKI